MICQWKKVKIQTKWRKIKNKKTKSESGLYGKVIIAMKSNTDASAVTLFSIVTDLCDSAKVESFATNTERKKKKKTKSKTEPFLPLVSLSSVSRVCVVLNWMKEPDKACTLPSLTLPHFLCSISIYQLLYDWCHCKLFFAVGPGVKLWFFINPGGNEGKW